MLLAMPNAIYMETSGAHKLVNGEMTAPEEPGMSSEVPERGYPAIQGVATGAPALRRDTLYERPMEIVRQQRDSYLELMVEGRLDGYWSQHLAAIVGEVMREGTHAVRLNLSKVDYVSSAGISVLVELYKSFHAVNGSFAIIEPSRPVLRVLEMVGLATLMAGGPMPAGARLTAAAEVLRREAGGAVFEIHGKCGRTRRWPAA